MPLLAKEEHQRQRQLAAWSSRLLPDALHISEYQILKGHLTNAQSAIYLTIRNDILRLWTRNPLVHVSVNEILERIKDKRLHSLVIFAHEWLARNGYINFGCIHIWPTINRPAVSPAKQQRIVIIGAGVSGLSTARQLTNIILQFPERWCRVRSQMLPRITILEGRQRIGGRVYSHALKNQVPGSLPHGLANTAEMGAQIITGFHHGNPLDALVRGQLTLEYHLMKDNMMLYDFDGTTIDLEADTKVQNLFNDLLEAASLHGWHVNQPPKTVHSQNPATMKQENMPNGSMKMSNGINNPNHTLGGFMDGIISKTNTSRAPLSALEMRLLHWHYANLEYANAVNVDQLSLGGWDQDQGNEFEGRHSEIKGGYSQVPKALFKYPQYMDVKLGKVVKEIHYNPDISSNEPRASVRCEDGETIEADYIVNTLPLGVLKEGLIQFNPPLPKWKAEPIQRLGFGVLNKVVLVFDSIFWDVKRDMFGILNQSTTTNSLNPADYASDRGMFYLFWNCVKTSGAPVLVGVMAGDAARAAESMADQVLVDMAVDRLAKIFQLKARPTPTEAIVTRWRRDRFARGSYSYMGPESQPGDYEAMAARTGNMFWAGEGTCGTHPATVHGAFISGLRAAGEVVQAMIGGIVPPVVQG